MTFTESSSFFLFLSLFISGESARASRGRAERVGKRLPSRLRAVSAEPRVGLELNNSEIMT